MSLNSVADFAGGAGVATGGLAAAMKELQGLNISLLAGKGAGVTNDLAGIRQEDTIIKALNNNAGVITDVTATTTIVDTHATGTQTVASAVAGDDCTVAGFKYTLVAADAVVGPMEYNKVKLGDDDAGTADNLAAAINRYEAAHGHKVTAVALAGVVTITAVADGTAGNALTLAETGSSFTKSGTTLLGGTATGGISVTGATDQVILFWYNKR